MISRMYVYFYKSQLELIQTCGRQQGQLEGVPVAWKDQEELIHASKHDVWRI